MHPERANFLDFVELTSDMVQLVNDKPMSTIQLAKVGSFKSKRYGKFSITEKHLDDVILNRQRIPNDPPVDYNHLSYGPTLIPDQGIAAGWIKHVEKRDDKTLWGTVEWTPKAAKHIQDGEFKYVSPVFEWDTKNEQGESLGASLPSAALTNYPFLKGMEGVSLSELMQNGVLLADLSLDQKRGRLSAALQDKYKDSTTYPWLRDVYDDYIVYEAGTKCYKLGYSVDSKFEVTFSGEPKEVVPQYVTLSANGGEDNMANEQNTADIVKLQKDFADLQTKFGEMGTKLTETTAKVVTLTAELEVQKGENVKLTEQLKKNDATSKVEALIRQGKIVPKQKDTMIELAMKDMEFFVKLTADLPVVVKLNTVHGSNEGDTEAAEFTAGGEDPIKLFDDKVSEYRTANPKASVAEAVEAVNKANPGLYEKRRDAFSRTTAVNGSTPMTVQ